MSDRNSVSRSARPRQSYLLGCGELVIDADSPASGRRFYRGRPAFGVEFGRELRRLVGGLASETAGCARGRFDWRCGRRDYRRRYEAGVVLLLGAPSPPLPPLLIRLKIFGCSGPSLWQAHEADKEISGR
jgi:hypothetical protein